MNDERQRAIAGFAARARAPAALEKAPLWVSGCGCLACRTEAMRSSEQRGQAPSHPPPTHTFPWLKWECTDGIEWTASTAYSDASPVHLVLQVRPTFVQVIFRLGIPAAPDTRIVTYYRKALHLHDLADAMCFAEDRALEMLRLGYGPLLDAAEQAADKGKR